MTQDIFQQVENVLRALPIEEQRSSAVNTVRKVAEHCQSCVMTTGKQDRYMAKARWAEGYDSGAISDIPPGVQTEMAVRGLSAAEMANLILSARADTDRRLDQIEGAAVRAEHDILTAPSADLIEQAKQAFLDTINTDIYPRKAP